MEYLVKRTSITSEKTACAVVAVFANKRLSDAAHKLDKKYRGIISDAVKSGDISGNLGQTLVVRPSKTSPHKRILLVGCGKSKALNIQGYKKIIRACAGALKSLSAADAISTLNELEIKDARADTLMRLHVIITEDVFYKYDETLSQKKLASRLKRIKFICEDPTDLQNTRQSIAQGKAIASGMMTTKELGNLPANICTPSYLAKRAKEINQGQKKLSLQVLEEAEMKKLGMGSLLSVSAGSAQPAKLIVLNYQGASKSEKPIVLVGKGITFDTGGISLKPGAAMDEMKFDMCGAATVLGTMQAINDMELPINVVGIVASAENMPGGHATKPGDVVTSMSGKTIEILNTDAEGRLILCDALTYAGRFNPDVVIDFATLTGACVVALGHEASGLMSNSDELSEDLLNAGQTTGDRAWPLPVWDEYQSQLDSNFADIANIGGRWAGTITAACFLSRFTEDYNWAHLDIAGTAWTMGGKNKGATGRPVPLITEYIIQRCED
ncbi:MAG: leucyl aminopeptidase [Pseudomonadota bacterium]